MIHIFLLFLSISLSNGNHVGSNNEIKICGAPSPIYIHQNSQLPLVFLSLSMAASTTLRLSLAPLVLLYSPVCSSHLQLFGRRSGTAHCSDILELKQTCYLCCKSKLKSKQFSLSLKSSAVSATAQNSAECLGIFRYRDRYDIYATRIAGVTIDAYVTDLFALRFSGN